MNAPSSEQLLGLMSTIRSELEHRDTDHAVFHGSWDWHSSVHGHWALLELADLLDQGEALAWAASRLGGGALTSEFTSLRDDPAFEYPYGRAWLLRLMITYERITQDRSYRDQSHSVAKDLLQRLLGAELAFFEREYLNPCWPLIQLWAFAEHSHDAEILEAVRFAVDRNLDRLNGALASDHTPPGAFFSPWALEALLIGSVLGADALKDRLQERAPDVRLVEEQHSSHHLAIHASRAWGFWAALNATGSSFWRDAYLEHLHASLALHPSWRHERRAYGHWVPQFSVYAALMPKLHGL